MKLKNKRLIIAVITVVVIAIGIIGIATTLAADTEYIKMDFEDGYTGDWSNDNKAIKTVETDAETDNKYLHLEYMNEENTAPLYFEISAPSTGAYSTLRMTGNTVMSFDVKFEGDDAGIYLKQRAENVNINVLRICVKQNGRLMYGTNGRLTYVWDNDGNYFYPQDKWYNIQIIAEIGDGEVSGLLQSIYVTDKETGEVVAKIVDQPIYNAAPYCNMVLIGASSNLNIDNFVIMNPDIVGVTIAGNPYPAKTTGTSKYKYYLKGKTASGLALYSVKGAEWSLTAPADGVSIDSATGVLTIDSSAQMQPIIIKAVSETDTAYYLVEIEE